MVLRKPYAFLIKHFKLIHLIITVLFGYVAFKNRGIYMYLKKVIEDTTNRYDALEYINYGLFIFIAIALILCFLVQWLLKYKDKPRALYKFTMIIYGVIAVYMFVLFTYMNGFGSAVVEQKTIRLYRDILTIMQLLQYYIVFVMLIRGLGFDIKKFNFGKDVQELNLSEVDSEEVEVNTHIDTTNVMRTVRKQRREFGYFLKEFKYYILVILVVVIAILGYRGYKFFNKKYRVYHENDYVGYKYILAAKNGYYATLNDKNYVIINFDICKYGKKELFSTGNLALQIGKKKYIADKTICSKFRSLGTCYKKQFVKEEPATYMLVYEVDEIDTKKTYLVYTDGYERNYKIKVNLTEYKNN